MSQNPAKPPRLMLSLLASPANGPAHRCFFLLSSSVLLYSDSDAVLILDPTSFLLRKVLIFAEVFPTHPAPIQHVAVDPAMNLVFAASQNRIAVWSLSQTSDSLTARVHSSLALPPSSHVSSLCSASGLLAVGSDEALAIYTLILENDLPTWSQKWSIDEIPTPHQLTFSPSLTYIAATSKQDTALHIYSTTTGAHSQSIPHPRKIQDVRWRYSNQSSRDDLIVYTITSDSTLRIFMPVLDDPTFLQLHLALDMIFPLPCEVPSTSSGTPLSSVFWLDREIVSSALNSKIAGSSEEEEGSQRRKIKEIIEQGWDIFLRILIDGSIVVTAVANIDRRPPTLLDHLTLQHTAPQTIKLDHNNPTLPNHLYILPQSNSSELILITTNPLTAYHLDLADLIFPQVRTSHYHGLRLIRKLANTIKRHEYDQEEELVQDYHNVRLARTPEGRGVAVLRTGRNPAVEVFAYEGRDRSNLTRIAKKHAVDMVVVLNDGRSFATYVNSSSSLTLYCSHDLLSSSRKIQLPSMTSLFSMPLELDSSSPTSSHCHVTEYIVGITVDHQIALSKVATDQSSPSSPSSLSSSCRCSCTLTLLSMSKVSQNDIALMLPVDPMAWSFSSTAVFPSVLDTLLSVNDIGELAFWTPSQNSIASSTEREMAWKCTGRVRTGKKGIKMARCSSAKKSVLVVPEKEGGEEMTIWDSQESAFSSGLEYTNVYSASTPINDLDWTATPDGQSVLAVGFKQHVDLLCQQRKTYFDDGPGWAICWRIDIGSITPLPIGDSIWLADGSLLVAAGKQLFLYGQETERTSGDVSLFEHVARHNGPLQDWHPQMLLQCLLWDKVELVKNIIISLALAVENKQPFEPLDVENFLMADEPKHVFNNVAKKRYSMLFNGPDEKDDDENTFSRSRIYELIKSLESDPLPYLTPNEQAHLQVLIQATLEIDEQRRSLDANGLRYLISMRSYYILNQRAKTSPLTPTTGGGGIPRMTGKRERLRYRDMIWAFYSESQEILLSAASSACQGKMLWSDARALGITVWLTSVEAMRTQLESIARNEYMAGDNRNPTACALFYFALGKVKLVHGLWRQAAWHKEQSLMLKFLSNNFSEPRWRTAALKNAFALLSKRRFEYAAAFFLLGDSLKDAVNVCIKNLGDFQLAIALARVVEQSNEGPILKDILNNAVLPVAFKEGNRWLANWAFWLLHRRDLAVRVLLSPLHDIASSLDIRVTEIEESPFDDTSLALLFSQLRSKTLQAAKGASEISGTAEWNFVLQIARVFCRMGCHVLALDLVRSWTFEVPSAPVVYRPPSPVNIRPPPPTSRPTVFGMQSHMRRRSSMIIDMEIPSLPPTRPASPDLKMSSSHMTIAEEPQEDEEPKKRDDLQSRKTGLGTLMKSAKHDVQVPEFDMGAFF